MITINSAIVFVAVIAGGVATGLGIGIYGTLKKRSQCGKQDDKQAAKEKAEDIFRTTHTPLTKRGVCSQTIDVDSTPLQTAVNNAPSPISHKADAPHTEGVAEDIDSVHQTQDTEQVNHETFTTYALREQVDSATDNDLRMLMLDRFDEIDDEENNLDAQALCAITLIDEIKQMQNAYAEPDKHVLLQISATLQEQIVALGGEILDSDTWNPAIQKIGQAEYTLPDGAETVITGKIASGLRMKGRLLRKQIIAINRSSSLL